MGNISKDIYKNIVDDLDVNGKEWTMRYDEMTLIITNGKVTTKFTIARPQAANTYIQFHKEDNSNLKTDFDHYIKLSFMERRRIRAAVKRWKDRNVCEMTKGLGTTRASQ